MADEFITAEEVAALLHLGVKRVQALSRAGRLPAVRVGRRWLFRRDRILELVGVNAAPQNIAPQHESRLEISSRNQLLGQVTALSLDGVMAEVRIRIGAGDLTAIITRGSAVRMKLHVGDEVLALVKATEVMVGRVGRAP